MMDVYSSQSTRQAQKKATLIRYIQKYPKGWKKRLELGDILYQMGEWTQAISEYRQIVNKQPHLLIVWLKLAKLYVKLNNQDEAIAAYQQALSLTEHLAIICHIQGEICACQRNYHKSIDLLKQATDLEPQQMIHWLALAKVQADSEHYEGAISAYRQVLSVYPDDFVCLSLVYEQLMLMGEIKEAEKILDVLETLTNKNSFRLRFLAYHRCQMGLITEFESKEIGKLIQRLQKADPHHPKSYEIRAYYHFLQGKEAEAIALWQQLTQHYPHSASSWYAAGKGLWQLGEYETASQFIQEAYRLSPQDPQIYQALWLILGDSSDKTHLPSLIDPLFSHFSHFWSIWTTLGQTFVEKLQETERGCSFAAQAIQLQPQCAKAWLAYGRVLLLGKKWPKAVTVLRQGWQLLPQDKETVLKISAAVWLAESYQGLSDNTTSQQWWQTASQYRQQFMTEHSLIGNYWQGKIWQGLAESEKAMATYQRLLQQVLPYPLREDIKIALKSLRQEEGVTGG